MLIDTHCHLNYDFDNGKGPNELVATDQVRAEQMHAGRRLRVADECVRDDVRIRPVDERPEHCQEQQRRDE